MEKQPMLTEQRLDIVKMVIESPFKNSGQFFAEIDKSKFIYKCKLLRIAKIIFEKKKFGSLTLLDFKLTINLT